MNMQKFRKKNCKYHYRLCKCFLGYDDKNCVNCPKYIHYSEKSNHEKYNNMMKEHREKMRLQSLSVLS